MYPHEGVAVYSIERIPHYKGWFIVKRVDGMPKDSSPEFESKPAALAALLDGTWPAELQEA